MVNELREKVIYSKMVLEKLLEIKKVIGGCSYCPFESECYAKFKEDESKCYINWKIEDMKDDVEFFSKRLKEEGRHK